ncbi:hypothetical protein [Pararobbsia silviterrae]|uniref:hypothetical protein n=1 Tax=Pararobbsia silviterrae TaxID=1792498 RepID=UPI0013148988|nr:hypothetical protein [Pararobbsia silviterrae]
MKSYRCFYLMRGHAPRAPATFIQLKALDAVAAAQCAMHVTGCAFVVDVIRVGS